MEGFRLHSATSMSNRCINLANFVRHVTRFTSEEGVMETGVEADHGGRVSIALLKLLRLVPEYGHFSQNNNSGHLMDVQISSELLCYYSRPYFRGQ